jgi:hypothetical protein
MELRIRAECGKLKRRAERVRSRRASLARSQAAQIQAGLSLGQNEQNKRRLARRQPGEVREPLLSSAELLAPVRSPGTDTRSAASVSAASAPTRALSLGRRSSNPTPRNHRELTTQTKSPATLGPYWGATGEHFLADGDGSRPRASHVFIF